MEMPQEGDFWLASFRFMETEEKKLRPVFVWRNVNGSVEVIFCTSKKMVSAFDAEAVLEPEEASIFGLNGSCKIDFRKRDKLPVNSFTRKLGSIYGPDQPFKRKALQKIGAAAKAAGLLQD